MKVEAMWLEEAQGFIRVTSMQEKTPLIYHINSKTARQYSGFRLILKDLKIVSEIIQTLKPLAFNGSSSVIKQSLSFYAIVTYAKCFTEAKGRGTRLKKEDALKYASPEEILEHERIMDQRHNYVAHGGLKGYEHNPVVASLNSDNQNKRVIEIYDNIMGLVDIDSQLGNFEDLVNSVLKYVIEKCETSFNRITTEIHEKNIEELYKLAIDPNNYDKVVINASKK